MDKETLKRVRRGLVAYGTALAIAVIPNPNGNYMKIEEPTTGIMTLQTKSEKIKENSKKFANRDVRTKESYVKTYNNKSTTRCKLPNNQGTRDVISMIKRVC